MFSSAKVSNKVSNAIWVKAADQRLRLEAPQRDSLSCSDTTCWCSRRESHPEPWNYEAYSSTERRESDREDCTPAAALEQELALVGAAGLFGGAVLGHFFWKP